MGVSDTTEKEWEEHFKELSKTSTSNLMYEIGYKKGRADAIDECIKTLAESEDTILSDRQYYTLMELKEQNNG